MEPKYFYKGKELKPKSTAEMMEETKGQNPEVQSDHIVWKGMDASEITKYSPKRNLWHIIGNWILVVLAAALLTVLLLSL